MSAVFGYGARATGVCLERPPQGDKTASAGWYNLAAVQRAAAARGRSVSVINRRRVFGEIKRATLARLAAAGAKLDLFVYSLAAPKRTDAAGVSYASTLKPIGAPFRSKTISLGNDQVTEIEIAPASDAEIAATRKVMGGEDIAAWTNALLEADLLAPGCRVVAYSYIGPELTFPIYRSGTIGAAKQHLETTVAEAVGDAEGAPGRRRLPQRQQGAGDARRRRRFRGAAVHQRAFQGDEGRRNARGDGRESRACCATTSGPDARPRPTPPAEYRIDNREMAPDVQARVAELWGQVTTENLFQLTDYAGFKRDFRVILGFEVPGVDYAAPVETDVALVDKA